MSTNLPSYNFTSFQYITFKIKFPNVNTKNLIEIPSQIKTRTLVTLIDINDFELYKKQNTEKKEFTNKLRECILSNNIIDDKLKNPIHNHKDIVSYVLLHDSNTWVKNIC